MSAPESPYANEEERDFAPCRSEPDVARHRQDSTGAYTNPVDCCDNRLRACAHRLDQIARHLRKGEQALCVIGALH
jgi:hypothetical protein